MRWVELNSLRLLPLRRAAAAPRTRILEALVLLCVASVALNLLLACSAAGTTAAPHWHPKLMRRSQQAKLTVEGVELPVVLHPEAKVARDNDPLNDAFGELGSALLAVGAQLVLHLCRTALMLSPGVSLVALGMARYHLVSIGARQWALAGLAVAGLAGAAALGVVGADTWLVRYSLAGLLVCSALVAQSEGVRRAARFWSGVARCVASRGGALHALARRCVELEGLYLHAARLGAAEWPELRGLREALIEHDDSALPAATTLAIDAPGPMSRLDDRCGAVRRAASAACGRPAEHVLSRVAPLPETTVATTTATATATATALWGAIFEATLAPGAADAAESASGQLLLKLRPAEAAFAATDALQLRLACRLLLPARLPELQALLEQSRQELRLDRLGATPLSTLLGSADAPPPPSPTEAAPAAASVTLLAVAKPHGGGGWAAAVKAAAPPSPAPAPVAGIGGGGGARGGAAAAARAAEPLRSVLVLRSPLRQLRQLQHRHSPRSASKAAAGVGGGGGGGVARAHMVAQQAKENSAVTFGQGDAMVTPGGSLRPLMSPDFGPATGAAAAGSPIRRGGLAF